MYVLINDTQAIDQVDAINIISLVLDLVLH